MLTLNRARRGAGGGLTRLTGLAALGSWGAEEGFVQAGGVFLLQILDHRFQLLGAKLFIDIFFHIFQRRNLALLYLNDVIAIARLDRIADLVDGEAESGV